MGELTGEEAELRRTVKRRAEKLRRLGTPLFVLPHEYAYAMRIIGRARASGMTCARIAEHCGTSASQISKHVQGMYKTMKRPTYEALKTLRPVDFVSRPHASRNKLPDGRYVPLGVGVSRRLQALRALGFTAPFLAQVLGTTLQAAAQLSRYERDTCYASTYQEVCALYEKYRHQIPEDCGISSAGILRAKSRAAREYWAPPHCWDDGTDIVEGFRLADIDNRNSFPEWTGHCGTTTGYYLHLKHDILVHHLPLRASHKRGRRVVKCEPCLEAKRQATGMKPSDIDKDDMFASFDAGENVRDIGIAFKCSERTVMRYRKEWKEARGDSD